MKYLKILGISAGALFVLLVVIGFSLDEPQPSNSSSSQEVRQDLLADDQVQTVVATGTVGLDVPGSQGPYQVIKVVDGDTVTIDLNGKAETIRLIGINTPETVDPRKPVECFGVEASNMAKELLTNKHVYIEMDPTQGERDKYSRLLAYIYREDGFFFNKSMILSGYAYEYTYNIPYKYQSEFKEAQRDAEINKRGLWAPGVCEGGEATPTQRTTSAPTPQSTQQTQSTSGYSCSANIYNCTDFSTHAEAQSVYEMCGGVSNDIHRLDQDKDGEACESLP